MSQYVAGTPKYGGRPHTAIPQCVIPMSDIVSFFVHGCPLLDGGSLQPEKEAMPGRLSWNPSSIPHHATLTTSLPLDLLLFTLL